jgi:chromate reductase, NAD(P)H dehydrogenase (quinone)
MRILGICGSLQAKSSNRTLLETAQRLTQGDVELALFEGLGDLPHFNPDQDGENVADAVTTFRRALAASDGVLIACPEYGHSLPGVLKNAIDWSISSGELTGKAVAITASSNMAGRGALGLAALAQTLRGVSAVIVGGESIVRGENFERDLGALLSELITTIRTPRGTFVVS